MTTGIQNVAIGSNAMGVAYAGQDNVLIGFAAGDAMTNTSNNIGVGKDALGALTSGDGHVAVGTLAGKSITTAAYSTSVGWRANEDATGERNVAVGMDAGRSVTTGTYNTCIGTASGYGAPTTGSYNISIGGLTRPSGDGTISHGIVIGYNIAGGGNKFIFGKPSNTVENNFDTNASWSRSSDERMKTNIADSTLGLDFVNDLRTRTFQWRENKDFPDGFPNKGETNWMNTGVTMHGMIAQEVKTALDTAGVSDFGGWAENDEGTQMLSQEMFIYPLIKAIQELSAKVEALENA
jgi:hypothetical protein